MTRGARRLLKLRQHLLGQKLQAFHLGGVIPVEHQLFHSHLGQVPQAVLAIHAEGSIEAEKLAMVREHDSARCVALAKKLGGI